MSETEFLTRQLFDGITKAGTLSPAQWAAFKAEHPMPAEQREAVLVATIGHVLTLTSEIQAEANRLAIALQRRG